MLRYSVMKAANSLYNTPPTWSIYMAGLVYKWLLSKGGVSAIEEISKAKAAAVYDVIDSHELYEGTVTHKSSRSRINITFRFKGTAEEADSLKQRFLEEAKAAGKQKRSMIGLAGHRSVGGMRASLYNANGLDAAQELAAFMTAFTSSV